MWEPERHPQVRREYDSFCDSERLEGDIFMQGSPNRQWYELRQSEMERDNSYDREFVVKLGLDAQDALNIAKLLPKASHSPSHGTRAH